ncbi:MAG TPA: GNAT family N-acetyltransferase [Anaerolineae bacterium]|nr:GNAT family N-acetyltransferase [Anaerolineae bacterium]
MDEHLAAQGIRFRDFRPEDIPVWVDIRNRTSPDEPHTVEQVEYQERTYPADNPRRRYAVESAEGKFIGLGACEQPLQLKAPGVYFLWMIVDPDWRRCGIGQALLAQLAEYARQQGAQRLWTACKENQDYSIRFLQHAGFTNYGLRFESSLDLTAFDEQPFSGAIERARQAGFEFTDLAAERLINPDADRQLYEIDRETRAEVPWPGGARSELTYEQFRQRALDGPDADPTGILIAKRAGKMVGLTALWLRKGIPLGYTAMTGVQRESRGQGVALALKLLSFRLMKERGCTEARTNNDTANPPILRLNEKLGYHKRPGVMLWERMLDHPGEIHD